MRLLRFGDHDVLSVLHSPFYGLVHMRLQGACTLRQLCHAHDFARSMRPRFLACCMGYQAIPGKVGIGHASCN